MAKRKRETTPDKIDKKLAQGCGQGVGSKYKPWLKVQDVPSEGRVTRLHGIKIDRQHEFFSDLERSFFYIVEFSDRVKDIQEQYPLLPIEQTVAIADELGIRHPTDPKTGENIVMTTDFLLTVDECGQIVRLARTVKYSKDLENYRTIEKLEIERRYWEKKGISWGVSTEREIDETVAWNIGILRPFYSLVDLDGFENMTQIYINKLTTMFKKEILENSQSIREIADNFDEKMMLKPGCGISLFKHLVITKHILIDMNKRLNIDATMNIGTSVVDKMGQGVETT